MSTPLEFKHNTQAASPAPQAGALPGLASGKP